MSTIFAPATAPGPAGVAVVRISGTEAGTALASLAGTLPEPRKAVLRTFRGPAGEVLDEGLALWFPRPNSFTGEDVVELHVHGGRATMRAVLDALRPMPGLRPAEPGEFTRRAFENGKLELTQVEALADLVQAETEGQRRQAARQLEGGLGTRLEAWRSEVLKALAHVEAAIDFAEDEVPDAAAGAVARVQRLVPQLDAALGASPRAERLRAGVHVAIVGPPNAGKSSLLNAIAGREAAIVSATAGTTRDVVEVHLDLDGMPVVLADTAGLRESLDEIEGEGIRRALVRAEAADLRIAVLDAADWPNLDTRTLAAAGPDALIVFNKADIRYVPEPALCGRDTFQLSAQTGAGMDRFMGALTARVRDQAGLTEEPGLTRARHREAVAESAAHLGRFLEGQGDVALRAEDLRLAVRALGRVTGRVDVEELLDVIFRDFCIGK